jgi:hypothetical protein
VAGGGGAERPDDAHLSEAKERVEGSRSNRRAAEDAEERRAPLADSASPLSSLRLYGCFSFFSQQKALPRPCRCLQPGQPKWRNENELRSCEARSAEPAAQRI